MQFKNLFDFYSYIEFCPLCKSRTSANSTISALKIPTSPCIMRGQELVFVEYSRPLQRLSINLLDNTISRNYSDSSYMDKCFISLGRVCNKYHFYYEGSATLLKDSLTVSDITVDKYHFVRMHGSLHFVVNGSFSKSTTNIRITTPGFHTKLLDLPFINFDLSSKKNIDAKLKTIQLLA